MQAGGAMHVTRSTRFLPLEVSAVMLQVQPLTFMTPQTRCSCGAPAKVMRPSQ